MPARTIAQALALLLIALVALNFAATTNAQSANPRLTLTAVNVTGLSQFSQEQVVRASGLQIGAPTTLADLQSAVDRLAKSGAFDSVNYRYETRATNLTADIVVVETKNVLPCLYDNFVWFTTAELDEAVKKRVPFYAAGKLPVTGESANQARAALQDLLHSKGLPGEVSYMPYAPMGGAVSALLFRIDGAAIPIKSVAFSGEQKVTAQQLADAAKGLIGQNYSALDVESYARAGLLPLYHQRGYLRATFAPVKVALVDPSSRGPAFDVALTLSVTEGDQYSLSSINWSGNQAIATTELAKAFGMSAREVANTEKIDVGFRNAVRVYNSHGYINAQVLPNADLDDAQKLAAYSVTVKEGSQYHMGSITFEGVSERVANILAKNWKLKPGDIYDSEYTNEFLSKVLGPELARNGLKNVKIMSLPQADPTALRVDLRIKLADQPPAK
ncbi:MAG: POTRA domain-containing protein [Candidatus Acidiferrales bacterium]